MVTDTLVEVACAVCGGERRVTVCSEREIEAHLEYLRWFHRRRLRSGSEGALAERADFTQSYATEVVACAACGLVFRSPRPPDHAIREAYCADSYGMRRLAALYDSQVALYRPKARFLARRLPSGSRVVEVGSFVGGFLTAGREQGWRVLGVDPGREVDAFCAERGLPVFSGTLPELAASRLPAAWQPGTLDCLAIWNAFDQLPDPQPTLSAARRLLRPGGLLALRVPNGACFRWAAHWMRRLPRPLDGWLRAALAWNNLLAFPYLHGYSVPTLRRLLAPHGFELAAAYPDTLCRLSDSTTRTWATWEERLLKLAIQAAAKVQGLGGDERHRFAPWLDLYFEVRGAK